MDVRLWPTPTLCDSTRPPFQAPLLNINCPMICLRMPGHTYPPTQCTLLFTRSTVSYVTVPFLRHAATTRGPCRTQAKFESSFSIDPRRYEIPIIGYLTVKLFSQLSIRREARAEQEKHQTRIDCNAIYGATDQKNIHFYILHVACRLFFAAGIFGVIVTCKRHQCKMTTLAARPVRRLGVRRARERNEN